MGKEREEKKGGTPKWYFTFPFFSLGLELTFGQIFLFAKGKKFKKNPPMISAKVSDEIQD